MAFASDRLRELREAAGLSREELAEKVGTTSVYIGRLERAEKDNPAFDLVVKLAAALGVTCEAFRADEPAAPAPPPKPAKKARPKAKDE